MTSSPWWWLCSNLGWSVAKPSSLSTQLTTATSKSVGSLLVHGNVAVCTQSISQSINILFYVCSCVYTVCSGEGNRNSCLFEFYFSLIAVFYVVENKCFKNHLSLVVNLGCLTWVRLQQPQEQRCLFLSLCAVLLCVQTIVWLIVFGIFNVHTESDASDFTQGHMNIIGDFALTVDWEKNPLMHNGSEPVSVWHLAFQSDAVPTEPCPAPHDVGDCMVNGDRGFPGTRAGPWAWLAHAWPEHWMLCKFTVILLIIIKLQCSVTKTLQQQRLVCCRFVWQAGM